MHGPIDRHLCTVLMNESHIALLQAGAFELEVYDDDHASWRPVSITSISVSDGGTPSQKVMVALQAFGTSISVALSDVPWRPPAAGVAAAQSAAVPQAEHVEHDAQTGGNGTSAAQHQVTTSPAHQQPPSEPLKQDTAAHTPDGPTVDPQAEASPEVPEPLEGEGTPAAPEATCRTDLALPAADCARASELYSSQAAALSHHGGRQASLVQDTSWTEEAVVPHDVPMDFEPIADDARTMQAAEGSADAAMHEQGRQVASGTAEQAPPHTSPLQLEATRIECAPASQSHAGARQTDAQGDQAQHTSMPCPIADGAVAAAGGTSAAAATERKQHADSAAARVRATLAGGCGAHGTQPAPTGESPGESAAAAAASRDVDHAQDSAAGNGCSKPANAATAPRGRAQYSSAAIRTGATGAANQSPHPSAPQLELHAAAQHSSQPAPQAQQPPDTAGLQHGRSQQPQQAVLRVQAQQPALAQAQRRLGGSAGICNFCRKLPRHAAGGGYRPRCQWCEHLYEKIIYEPWRHRPNLPAPERGLQASMQVVREAVQHHMQTGLFQTAAFKNAYAARDVMAVGNMMFQEGWLTAAGPFPVNLNRRMTLAEARAAGIVTAAAAAATGVPRAQRQSAQRDAHSNVQPHSRQLYDPSDLWPHHRHHRSGVKRDYNELQNGADHDDGESADGESSASRRALARATCFLCHLSIDDAEHKATECDDCMVTVARVASVLQKSERELLDTLWLRGVIEAAICDLTWTDFFEAPPWTSNNAGEGVRAVAVLLAYDWPVNQVWPAQFDGVLTQPEAFALAPEEARRYQAEKNAAGGLDSAEEGGAGQALANAGAARPASDMHAMAGASDAAQTPNCAVVVSQGPAEFAGAGTDAAAPMTAAQSSASPACARVNAKGYASGPQASVQLHTVPAEGVTLSAELAQGGRAAAKQTAGHVESAAHAAPSVQVDRHPVSAHALPVCAAQQAISCATDLQEDESATEAPLLPCAAYAHQQKQHAAAATGPHTSTVQPTAAAHTPAGAAPSDVRQQAHAAAGADGSAAYETCDVGAPARHSFNRVLIKSARRAAQMAATGSAAMRGNAGAGLQLPQPHACTTAADADAAAHGRDANAAHAGSTGAGTPSPPAVKRASGSNTATAPAAADSAHHTTSAECAAEGAQAAAAAAGEMPAPATPEPLPRSSGSRARPAAAPAAAGADPSTAAAADGQPARKSRRKVSCPQPRTQPITQATGAACACSAGTTVATLTSDREAGPSEGAAGARQEGNPQPQAHGQAGNMQQVTANAAAGAGEPAAGVECIDLTGDDKPQQP